MLSVSLIDTISGGSLLLAFYLILTLIVGICIKRAFYWPWPGIITYLIMSVAAVKVIDPLQYYYWLNPPAWTKVLHIITYKWLFWIAELMEHPAIQEWPVLIAVVLFVVTQSYHFIVRLIIVSRGLFVLNQGELSKWNRPMPLEPGSDEADIKITNQCLGTKIKVYRIGLTNCIRIKDAFFLASIATMLKSKLPKT